MSQRERLRALWWHADAAGRWDRLATLEQLGRSGDRRRRWSALQEASTWAGAWAWDVSRSLADNGRPARSQEAARVAGWEANHLISNGGELALIAQWLRAAGEPAPEPRPPEGDPPLRLGQAARLIVMLGPDDVPVRSDYLRLAGRAAAAAGGWAQLRGFLDTIDLTTADGRRALRAAVGAMHPKALQSPRTWNALRARLPRLPDAEAVGVGDSRRGRRSGEGGTRRRRRRRLRGEGTDQANANANASANASASASENSEQPRSESGREPASGGGTQEQAEGQGNRRRRRRRRRPRQRGEGGAASPTQPPSDEAS
jgi:hypothetical protein